ncbi:uncharacterized protein TNCV_1773981 [Trichonephila clavipes]|nr:uncharacterized protein TNCV_1773981 [Trichonephila clavipes]
MCAATSNGMPVQTIKPPPLSQWPISRALKGRKKDFYSSQQRRVQEPTDFIYYLSKLHKQLELGMSEEALVDHIFVRLESQVQDYVEVARPSRRERLGAERGGEEVTNMAER